MKDTGKASLLLTFKIQLRYNNQGEKVGNKGPVILKTEGVWENKWCFSTDCSSLVHLAVFFSDIVNSSLKMETTAVFTTNAATYSCTQSKTKDKLKQTMEESTDDSVCPHTHLYPWLG